VSVARKSARTAVVRSLSDDALETFTQDVRAARGFFAHIDTMARMTWLATCLAERGLRGGRVAGQLELDSAV